MTENKKKIEEVTATIVKAFDNHWSDYDCDEAPTKKKGKLMSKRRRPMTS
jgi:predicted secreted Zn-dependent protease